MKKKFIDNTFVRCSIIAILASILSCEEDDPILSPKRPAQVSLTSPSDGAIEVALIPIFSWQAVDEAESYALEVSINRDLASPVIDQSGLTETSYEVENSLQAGRNYYWRVRAANGAGDGEWSEIHFFTTLDPPSRVILRAPSDRATGIALIPTFSWQVVDGAETYALEVSSNRDLTSPVIDQSGLIETSYEVTRSLEIDTDYYWRVRAANGAGDGEWSEIHFFTTLDLPSQVILSAPSDGATGIALIPTFSWQVVDGAETYALEVSINRDLTSPVIDQSGLTETSYSSASLQDGTDYYWRVRASNGAGDGPWSGTNSFMTLGVANVPPQVILSAPADGATRITRIPTFSWEAVDEAETYALEVSINSNLTSPMIDQSGLTETSYLITRLQLGIGIVYYWRVRASNRRGDGPWSGINSFTIERDMDGDGVRDVEDIDDDNDGLIEINNLEDLDNIRYNLAGTSYKTSATDRGNTRGAPILGLKGYELVRGLDFADPTSYSNGMVNSAWTRGSGWLPIGNNSTRFTGILEGNGHKITNLMIRRDISNIGLFRYIGTSGRVRNLGLENAVADYTGNNDSPNYIGLLAGQSEGTIIAVHTSGMANGGDGNKDRVGGLVGDNGAGRITACYATGNVNGGDGGDFVGGLVGDNGAGTIAACYATGNVNGGDGDRDRVGGLVGNNEVGTITASYATGMADGGDGDDAVGGLVGDSCEGTITASYATGMADGGDGDDAVGGLVGNNFDGTITASYATGNANGGDGRDFVGGLVGDNFGGTITASYATGMADGGDGDDDVGGLVGDNFEGTIAASYGFGTAATGDTEGVSRSGDASATVDSASALTMMNSSTMEANRWPARVWDFGTSSQAPVLKWITGYNSSGATDEAKYPCSQALLPDGRSCGGIIPGQGR